MSAGKPAGASSPPMLSGATSKPCSLTVGTSGIDGLRFSANSAGMREPAARGRGQRRHREIDLPADVIWIDSAGPLNGTWLNGTLLICDSSAIDRCGMVPRPGLP